MASKPGSTERESHRLIKQKNPVHSFEKPYKRHGLVNSREKTSILGIALELPLTLFRGY